MSEISVKNENKMSKQSFFNRNVKVINRVVRGRVAQTGRTVHGSRAQNAQMPRILEKKDVRDWDIFAKNPKKAARNMEKALDKKFGRDAFHVKKGKSKKLIVHKVVSNVTNEGFVDFAKPDRNVPTVAKRGVNFATLEDQKRRALANLRDPKRSFREKKDRDFLNRLRKFEKQRGRKI